MEIQRNPQDMTLQELTQFLESNGGHLKGRGDGTVKWEEDDE